MKRHSIFLMILLAALFCFCACSESDDSDETTPGGGDPGMDGDLDEPGEEEEEGEAAPICKTPPGLGDGPYFTDITNETGIGAGGLAVTGNRIVAIDLDGDDYPDLVVHAVSSNARDDLEASPPLRLKWVLMNRPDPADSSKRIFVNVTDESGFTATRDGGLGRSAQLAVFGDLNNDGRLDAFSGTHSDSNNPETDPGDRSEILLGDGNGNFSLAEQSDTTPWSGFLWSTTGASLLDFDRDGRLDVWVGFFYEHWGYLKALQNRLYKGNGDGSFTDVTDAYSLTTTDSGYEEGTNHKPTYGITVCDVNDDGDPDLLASSYGRQFNELWLNNGDSFLDVSLTSGFATDEEKDYGDNEFYKCYCTLHECDPEPGSPRVVCPEPADSYWSADDTEDYRLGGNTFSTVCGDWTGDGLPDIFNAEIVHWHIGSSSDPSQLVVNESTGDDILFTRPGRVATGLTRNHIGSSWNEGDITAMRLDFDLDGYPDLYIGDSDYPNTWGKLYRQTGDAMFTEITAESGAKHLRASGLTFADFDRDGDLDMVIGSSLARESPWDTAEVHLYRNDVGQDSNAVRISLKGKGAGHANKSAIGARVKVTTGGRTQTEWVDGGHGHFGMQHELPLTIGLGDSCVIDELEVRWPNGELTVDSWTDVPANVHITIEEGEEPVYGPLAL